MAVYYQFKRLGSGSIGVSSWQTTTQAIASLEKSGIKEYQRVNKDHTPYMSIIPKIDIIKEIAMIPKETKSLDTSKLSLTKNGSTRLYVIIGVILLIILYIEGNIFKKLLKR